MILPMLLAAVAVVPIGLATPRQAEQLFGRRLGAGRRRRLRWLGFTLLAVSFALAWGDADQGRALVTWFGVAGAAALALGLAFTLLAARRPRPAPRAHRRRAASARR